MIVTSPYLVSYVSDDVIGCPAYNERGKFMVLYEYPGNLSENIYVCQIVNVFLDSSTSSLASEDSRTCHSSSY